MRHRMIALAVVLLVAGLARAEGEHEVTWLAMMLNDEKVGYVRMERDQADGKVTTAMHTEVSFLRGGMPLAVVQDQKYVETAEGKPLGFTSTSNMGIMAMKAEGTVDDQGRMKITQDLAGQKTERTIELPKGTLFPEGLELETLRRGLKPGTEYEVLTFVPDFLSVVKAKVKIGEKEKLDLFGRVVEGTKVTTIMKLTIPTPGGPAEMEVPSVSYVNDENDLLRMDTEVMGMRITAFECDEAFALSKAKSTTDFFDDMLITGPKAIPADAAKVVYTLRPKPDKKVSIPTTDTQKVTVNGDGTITVTVERLDPPAGHVRPYKGDDAALAEDLKPNTYIQSEDLKVVEAARKAVGSETDAAAAAKKIAQWVHENIREKTLSVGYASASEVLAARQGDCTEHSVLAAALCRAAGIPARVAVGLQYVPEYDDKKNVFAGHQWTQVNVGGKWYELDATRPPHFRDATRITLAVGSGEIRDFFTLLGSFGLFDIVDTKATGQAP